MSSSGRVFPSLLPVKNYPRKDVGSKRTMAYTVTGEYAAMEPGGMGLPASGVTSWKMVKKLLVEGKLQIHPP
ncbi:MAG: hypothetical protein M1835_001891 [Candelina submexicana]|nr:MAG: hypothetical protein M1835_001891 [Candelina submexicana]